MCVQTDQVRAGTTAETCPGEAPPRWARRRRAAGGWRRSWGRGCPRSQTLVLACDGRVPHGPWRAGATPAARAGTGASTEQAARQPQPSLSSPGGSPTCTAMAFSNTVSSKQGIVRDLFSICSRRERLRSCPLPVWYPQRENSPHPTGTGWERQGSGEKAWACKAVLLARINVMRTQCRGICQEISSPETAAEKRLVHFQGRELPRVAAPAQSAQGAAVGAAGAWRAKHHQHAAAGNKTPNKLLEERLNARVMTEVGTSLLITGRAGCPRGGAGRFLLHTCAVQSTCLSLPRNLPFP